MLLLLDGSTFVLKLPRWEFIEHVLIFCIGFMGTSELMLFRRMDEDFRTDLVADNSSESASVKRTLFRRWQLRPGSSDCLLLVLAWMVNEELIFFLALSVRWWSWSIITLCRQIERYSSLVDWLSSLGLRALALIDCPNLPTHLYNHHLLNLLWIGFLIRSSSIKQFSLPSPNPFLIVFILTIFNIFFLFNNNSKTNLQYTNIL